MKFLKGKKGKKYPEMVDTIHGDAPDEAILNERIPDEGTSDEPVPNGRIPDEAVSDGRIPDKAVSDGRIPDGAVSDGRIPDEAVPDGRIPDEAASDGRIPDGAAPDEKIPDGRTPDETFPDRRVPDHGNPDEEISDEDALSENVSGFSDSAFDAADENGWPDWDLSDDEASGHEPEAEYPDREDREPDFESPYEEVSPGQEEDEFASDAGEPSERDLARQARMRRRKRELRRVRITICLLILLLFAAAGAVGYWLFAGRDAGPGLSGDSGRGAAVTDRDAEGTDVRTEPAKESQTEKPAAQSGEAQTEKTPEPQSALTDVAARADLMAAQYDYDGAISLLQSQETYASDTAAQNKVAEYQALKEACVEVSPDTVSHVFVHSLIVDPSRAFDGDAGEKGYNLNMVTLDEFKKIIQSMYEKGFVLVSLHDMGEIDANGKMQRKSILLPEGKKPVIFSQDDVSYYHSYANDGFADRLIVDENGEVKNEYTDAAGNTTVGDYDMVPVLDTFIKEHPDFSYHGRKGIVVLTGYNGVLGYHTDGDYRDKLALQEDQAKWLEEHPEFDFDADVAAATKVADAMKASGWEFASHTWGHISVSDVSLEKLQTDTQKWLDYVSPIVGGTDMIIFAFGSDIGDWTGYSSDNEKFNYLKSVGFDYFCNVDGSSLSWVQFGDTYLRTGRMNIDGYRMATNPDILAPLFDVSQVYDYNNRPQMSEWSQ